LAAGLRCHSHRFDHVAERVFGEVQLELAGLDLGDVEHRVDQAQQMLAVRLYTRDDRRQFLGQGTVDALVQQLGIAEHGGERGSELMAHVCHEL
jgi:hypothetical protein